MWSRCKSKDLVSEFAGVYFDAQLQKEYMVLGRERKNGNQMTNQ